MVVIYNNMVEGCNEKGPWKCQLFYKAYLDKNKAIKDLIDYIREKHFSNVWHIEVEENVPIDNNDEERITPYKVSVTHYHDDYKFRLFYVREIKLEEKINV